MAGTISAGRCSLTRHANVKKLELLSIAEMCIPFTEVFDTLGGDSVVIVLPRELGLDETLGCQTLEGLDNFKVRNVEIFMFGEVVVLLGNQHSLYFKLSAPEYPPHTNEE